MDTLGRNFQTEGLFGEKDTISSQEEDFSSAQKNEIQVYSSHLEY